MRLLLRQCVGMDFCNLCFGLHLLAWTETLTELECLCIKSRHYITFWHFSSCENPKASGSREHTSPACLWFPNKTHTRCCAWPPTALPLWLPSGQEPSLAAAGNFMPRVFEAYYNSWLSCKPFIVALCSSNLTHCTLISDLVYAFYIQ